MAYRDPQATSDRGRPITPRARWRAWLDPRVRFAWGIGVVLAIIGLGFAAEALIAYRADLYVIQHGTPVNAVVKEANDYTKSTNSQAPDALVVLGFDWHGEMHLTPSGRLPNRRERITPGDIIPLHVNPDNPDDWTWLSTPAPLMPRMVPAVVSILAALLALLASAVLRYRVLQLFRHGTLGQAIVLDVRIGPLAPEARFVRVTPDDDSDRTAYGIYVPARLLPLQAGDAIPIIAGKGRSSAALSPAWFE